LKRRYKCWIDWVIGLEFSVLISFFAFFGGITSTFCNKSNYSIKSAENAGWSNFASDYSNYLKMSIWGILRDNKSLSRVLWIQMHKNRKKLPDHLAAFEHT